MAKREVGYTYAVRLGAVVEITLGPDAPEADLKAALLANVMDLLEVAVPEPRGEITDELRIAGGDFVDGFELLETRDLMTGKLIGESRL